jgi:hypothetical protein
MRPESAHRWKISGHSLGGGLASAASVVSEVYCHTFNAAGLHLNSVKEIFEPKILTKASMDWIANEFITAYYVDWDILHFLQTVASTAGKTINYLGETFFATKLVQDMPVAAGKQIELPSGYTLNIVGAAFVSFVFGNPMGGTVAIITSMVLAHRDYVNVLLSTY